MAYGTKLAYFATIEDAERHALDCAYCPQGASPCGFLYRVEAVSYSYIIDADYEEYGSTAPALELQAYRVRNWTTYGATLSIYSGARPKWVDLRPGAKQWASRSAREAVEQFAARRKRQLYVLEGQMLRARYELQLAEGLRMTGAQPICP